MYKAHVQGSILSTKKRRLHEEKEMTLSLGDGDPRKAALGWGQAAQEGGDSPGWGSPRKGTDAKWTVPEVTPCTAVEEHCNDIMVLYW